MAAGDGRADHNVGIASIAGAAGAFSLATLCVKVLTSPHDDAMAVPVFEITAFSSALCLPAVSVALWAHGGGLHAAVTGGGGPPRMLQLVLLRALLGAAALSLFYSAMQLLPMREAVTLFFTSPVLVALLERALLPRDQHPSHLSVTGCVLTVLGVVLVAQQSFGTVKSQASHGQRLAPTQHAAGVLLASAAAAANAGAFVTIRVSTAPDESPSSSTTSASLSALVLTWWYHALVLATSAVALLLRFPASPVLPGQRDGALLVCVAAAQLVGQVLLNRGFQLVSATRGSAVNMLQVPLAFLFDVFVLRSRTNAIGAAGAALVVAGVLAVTAFEDQDRDQGLPWVRLGAWATASAAPALEMLRLNEEDRDTPNA